MDDFELKANETQWAQQKLLPPTPPPKLSRWIWIRGLAHSETLLMITHLYGRANYWPLNACSPRSDLLKPQGALPHPPLRIYVSFSIRLWISHAYGASDSCMCSSHVREIKFDFLLSICLPLIRLFSQPKRTRGGKGKFFPSSAMLNSTVFVSVCPSSHLHSQPASSPLWSVWPQILAGLSGCLWLAAVTPCQTDRVGDKRLLTEHDRKRVYH